MYRLPIFPEGSLSSSVITTVYVGVWIVCFFNLRLGWAFSGLVVPGYLAPLLLAKPWAAAVVCAEGLATYLLVYFLSEVVSRWGLWCGFFGRDRFFALVLASVAVRLVCDAWLLPLAAEWVNARFGLEFDYHNNLHSYGLIVVALLANQFWKPGLVRGTVTVFVPILLTALIVRFVLMPYTNFSVGNLQYMYEDIAASLLASPKAYIILITTAFLASRMNLHYNWEFNGILIPALIALQWYEPVKILTTVVEAAVIYWLAVLALRLPVLRKQSFEGARKLLLFFSVGFAWKIALGFVVAAYWPAVAAKDYYGFGYLLTTLLALKAHDKGIVVRMTSATFQVSIVGAIAGGLVGFLLTLAPRPTITDVAPEIETDSPGTLEEAIRREKLALYEGLGKSAAPPPGATQRLAFSDAMRELLAYTRLRDPQHLRAGAARLKTIGYRALIVESRYLCLREEGIRRGWGFFVLALDRSDGVTLLAPSTHGDWMAEAGLALFHQMKGGALALGGTTQSQHSSTWLLAQTRRSLFDAFVDARMDTDSVTVSGSDDERNHLRLKARLPGSLDLARLRERIGGIEIYWQPNRGAKPDTSQPAAVELALSRASRRALHIGQGKTGVTLERANGRLRPWLLNSRTRIADAGTNHYQSPTQQELLVFAHEVLHPLLRVRRNWTASVEDRRDLEAIAVTAAGFGYRVIWHSDASDYLILSESDRLPRRHWGTYVFRPGGEPFAVSIPRPIFERNSIEYGTLIFERLRARAFLLHGAHPDANQDRTADVLSPRNRLNLFNLAGQVVLGEEDEPLLLVQSRAFGVRPTGRVAEVDCLLATSNGATTKSGLSPLSKQVLATLEADRLKVGFADGSPEAMGYEASATPQASYLSQSRNKELLLVWMSPLTRPLYRQQADNRIQESHFRAVNIPTIVGDLHTQLSGEGGSGIPPELRRVVEQYVIYQDIVILHQMTTTWPNVRFTRVIDQESQQAFLVIQSAPGSLPVIANLAPPRDKRIEPKRVLRRSFTAAEVLAYIDSRVTWLEIGATP